MSGSPLIGLRRNCQTHHRSWAGKGLCRAPRSSSRKICCGRRGGRKNLPGLGKVPEICLLDPDGRYSSGALAKRRTEAAARAGWACYHTDLYEFEHEDEHFGVIGCAVGASLCGVLLAEQLFASGCRLLISMTSARADRRGRGRRPLFHPDRPGAARRGHQLSLPAAGRVRRGRGGGWSKPR